jgi:mannosyl-3-phosphoglycerate phosphatase
MPRFIVFTDLDGTLLDQTYSYEAARPALKALQEQGIPLVLVSSKTRAEIEHLRSRMGHHGAFIVENGGALLVPQGWPHGDPEVSSGAHDQVTVFGTPYPVIRAALKEMSRSLHVTLKGFGDMTIQDLARLSGLAPDEARLALTREYDEPFRVSDGHVTLADLRNAAAKHGLTCTKGGGFYHLLGPADKGKACRHLIDSHVRLLRPESPKTVGIGDTLNDRSMLAEVDIPILVQRPDGSYDPDVNLPALRRAAGIGPAGWNAALLDLLDGERSL